MPPVLHVLKQSFPTLIDIKVITFRENFTMISFCLFYRQIECTKISKSVSLNSNKSGRNLILSICIVIIK